MGRSGRWGTRGRITERFLGSYTGASRLLRISRAITISAAVYGCYPECPDPSIRNPAIARWDDKARDQASTAIDNIEDLWIQSEYGLPTNVVRYPTYP
jgi:hypothetical protein